MSLMTTGLLQVVWIIDDGVTFVVSAQILPSVSVSEMRKVPYKGVQYILTFFFLLLLVQVHLFRSSRFSMTCNTGHALTPCP